QPRPRRDDVTSRPQLLSRVTGRENAMRADAETVHRRHEIAQFFFVQSVVEAGELSGRIPEGGMNRNILDPLAIEVDGAIIPQRLQVFRTRHQVINNSSLLRHVHGGTLYHPLRGGEGFAQMTIE